MEKLLGRTMMGCGCSYAANDLHIRVCLLSRSVALWTVICLFLAKTTPFKSATRKPCCLIDVGNNDGGNITAAEL
jgi:hypothetical protein